MSTTFRVFVADKERDLKLTPQMVIELERVTLTGIGALFNRVTSRAYRHSDLTEVIRLGMIGGGEDPKRAAQLVESYIAPRPIAEILNPALGTLNALFFGTPLDESEPTSAGKAPMIDQLEIKAMPDAALNIDDDGILTGIAWRFDSPDRYGDVIEKGAFNLPTSLPMLIEHKHGQAVGVWHEIKETDVGLEIKGRLSIDDVPRAREIRDLLKEGRIGGLSVGFYPQKAPVLVRGGRSFSAVNLSEISIVSRPLHPGARVLTVKAESAAETLEHEQVTETATAAAPDLAALEQKIGEVAEIQKSMPTLVNRLDAIEARFNRPNFGTTANDNGTEEMKSFETYLRTGQIETKSLSMTSPSTGGVLVPTEYRATVIEKVMEFSPIRSLATVLTMGGSLLEMPRLVDEVEPASVTELGTRAEDEPSFETVDVKPFEMSVIVPVSRQLLEDSAIDLMAFLSTHLGRKFGQKEANWFVVGNGTTQARGVLTGTDVASIDTSTTGAIKADDLIDTFYSIKSAYSARGSWLMNRSTMAAIRKLKDSDGNYLWQAGLVGGQPPMILGRPVYEAPDMPSVAEDVTPIIFGDFASGYLIADRIGPEIKVDDVTGYGTGIVKVLARRRVGGRVILPEALTKLNIKAA